jgi:hypothetical protein
MASLIPTLTLLSNLRQSEKLNSVISGLQICWGVGQRRRGREGRREEQEREERRKQRT